LCEMALLIDFVNVIWRRLIVGDVNRCTRNCLSMVRHNPHRWPRKQSFLRKVTQMNPHKQKARVFLH